MYPNAPPSWCSIYLYHICLLGLHNVCLIASRDTARLLNSSQYQCEAILVTLYSIVWDCAFQDQGQFHFIAHWPYSPLFGFCCFSLSYFFPWVGIVELGSSDWQGVEPRPSTAPSLSVYKWSPDGLHDKRVSLITNTDKILNYWRKKWINRTPLLWLLCLPRCQSCSSRVPDPWPWQG